MSGIIKKRSLKILIGSAIALIFTFVFAFIASPKVYAATSTIESLTLANINSGNAQGQYGNFSWDNSKLKSVSNSEITTDRSKDPFCIVWTRPSSGSYASALNFSVNVVDSVGAIDIRYDATVPSYISPGEKQSGTLTNNVNSLSSKYEKIYFYISYSYMYNDVKLTSVSIQIKATTYPISFSKGTGIKAAFLSTNNSATSGSASGTAFAKFDTVYCFAKLDKGYKAQSSWTLISGTANSEDAIYRVGSNTVSTSYSFGTLNAIAKTASIYRYGNGGSNLGYVSLTYGSSAELGTPTRTGYEFKGWNTAQNGTGNTISSSLTADEVNAIIDAGTPTSVYAQWSINAAGVDVLIENIGQVSYTSESKSKIDKAREAYNSLDSEEQALVTKYATLTTAEATYVKLKADNEAADAVDALIGNIGEVEYTDSSKGRIDKAREAYNALTADQQALVENYSTLTAAETEYAKLKADNEAADAVDALIGNIGEAEYTESSKGRIDAAREAYNALTADQQALVENYDDLTTAEARYNELKSAYDNATTVVEKIDAIGTVTYPDSNDKITDARAAYDALTTDDERGFVNNYSTLTAAETEYQNQKITGANNVKTMINEIPSEIDYDDDECVDKIFEAREAYDALTEEQQALVDNYAKLTAAEARYKELDDQAAANVIIGLINDIDEVAYPTSKGVIDVARAAYDSLTADQKALVTNYSTLTDAETEYNNQKVTGANNVKNMIDAIPSEVDYDDEECVNKIFEAREAYDALTEEQQSLVTNYSTLTTAEATYKNLDDNAKANAVDALISAIGTVEYTTTCKNKIDAARTAYDALTSDQKGLVPTGKLSDLINAENDYATLKANHDAADAVITKINAIGEVEYTTTCKNKIDAARSAYDALTTIQKELVTNYKTLTDAEKKYDELELAATRHSLDDKERGVEIETSDGTGIPTTITLKVEVKTTVSATEGSTAYANIEGKVNGNEKISGVYDVKLIQTINGVEKVVQPADIKAGTKIKIHIAIPEGVNPEETRILHIHSENDIEYVENVEVVGNEFVFEVDRLSEFALVTLTHGIPGWSIALIVIGCVLLLCCGCYLLLFFVFNKWINKDGKAVRVFKLGKKDDKVRVIIMPCKFEYKEETEVFKTKEEAMK